MAGHWNHTGGFEHVVKSALLTRAESRLGTLRGPRARAAHSAVQVSPSLSNAKQYANARRRPLNYQPPQ